MGESVKDFPLDVVKIEGSHETDSVSNDFIKTETSSEYKIIKNECLPQFQTVGAACIDDVKSENPITETCFQQEVKQETVTDDESDIVSLNYNIVKQEKPFDDNTFLEDSAAIANSNLNLTHENIVKPQNLSDVLRTDSVKMESCNMDKDIHNNGTSSDVSVYPNGPGSQHKTGPGKYLQGSNTDIESGSLPEDDSNVEIDIADDGREGLVNFPDFSLDVEGRVKGHNTEQPFIYKPFSRVDVANKSLITTTFRNTLSSHSVQLNDNNPKEKHFFDSCKEFSGQSSLQYNIGACSAEKPSESPTCFNSKAFSRGPHLQLQAHNRNNSEEKLVECPTCGKAFTRQRCLQIHIRTHTGEKPFECPTCGKGFSQQSNLQDHIRTHTGEKPFECPTCSKRFSQQSNLQTHIRTHTGEKPFECPTCGKAFSAQSNLLNHTRTHAREKSFVCPICGEAFFQQSNLQCHIRTHRGKRPFVCLTCDKSFTRQQCLQIHIRTHTQEKPYQCPTCDKSFSAHTHLYVHTRTHTGERPFECLTCGKAFSQNSHLQRHVRTHTGEKPFLCPTCGRGFSQQQNLQAHYIRTHAEEKPFECPTCGKAFSKQSHLKNHIRTHT